MKKIIFQCILLLFCAGAVRAVMVGKEKAICPICNKQIEILEIGSFGSYIYEQESKYDLIFFPYTYPEFIYTCPNCGYAQPFDYFNNVTEKQKEALRGFLADKWHPIPTKNIDAETRFAQAILVSRFLERDEDFWTRFYRVLIYHYRKDDSEKAKEYAEKEIALLLRNKGEFSDPQKNRLYLLGEYNHLLGNKELAIKYFSKARATDAASDIIMLHTVAIISNAVLLILLLLLWITAKASKKQKVILTIAIVVLFFLVSAALYISPKAIKWKVQSNDYYDDIINSRLSIVLKENM